jgi:hypothetical protein
MGGFLVSKLVKPTKVFCSWASYETGFSRLRFPEAKPNIRAVAARVLREANSTVSQEVARLDSSNRVFCQLAELAALFIGDCGAQILDLNQSLADEDDLSDLRDSRHPGIAQELRIESQQTVRLLGVAARCGFPLNQATLAVQLSDGVNIRYEVIVRGNWPGELDLQLAAWLPNTNTVFLAFLTARSSTLMLHIVPR